MEDRCVCCGEIIPEGRQVCPICEKKAASVKPKRNTCIYCGIRISRYITVCSECSKKLPIVRRLIAAGNEIKRLCGVKEWDSKKRSEISRNEPREQ